MGFVIKCIKNPKNHAKKGLKFFNGVNYNFFAPAKTLNNILSSFRSSNLYGCQFHPEKSSRVGAKFLKFFLDLNA